MKPDPGTEAKQPDGAVSSTEAEPSVEEALVEEDLLVEDVSIDGMCGVY